MKKISLLFLNSILVLVLILTLGACTPGPSITVLSPNGGEQWNDTGNPVSFKAVGVEKVNIDLEDWEGNPSGGPFTWSLETDLPVSSSGKYAITAVKDLVPKVRSGSNFKIRAWAMQSTGQIAEDRSDNYFSITTSLERIASTPLIPSSITLTSPNGGEQWETSETHIINWASSGYNPNASIQIGLRDTRYDPNIDKGEITITNTTNTGNYSWTIPSTIKAGSFFKIVIYIDGGGPKKSDLSDSYFQITQATTSETEESIPVIAAASLPSTLLSTGEKTLYRWTITAGEKNIGWKEIEFNISGRLDGGVIGSGYYDPPLTQDAIFVVLKGTGDPRVINEIKVWDGNGALAGTVFFNNTITMTDGSFVRFEATNKQIILAGTTKIYELSGNVLVSKSGDAVATKINKIDLISGLPTATLSLTLP